MKTLELINQYIEKYQELKYDNSLHAGDLGHDCKRYRFLKFRNVEKATFTANKLARFKAGNLFEEEFFNNLLAICVKIKKGERLESLNGHLVGIPDGVIESGLPDMPDERILWECKTMSQTRFNALVKHGIVAKEYQYFMQCQFYMYKLGIKYCYFVARDENSKEIHEIIFERDERIVFDDLTGSELVFGDIPPVINEDEDDYRCKNMCPMKEICRGRKVPDINCRTCIFSEPTKDGGWTCLYHEQKNQKFRDAGSQIPRNIQDKGCSHHIYRYDLLTGLKFEAIEESDDLDDIEVLMKTKNDIAIILGNQKDGMHFSSWELKGVGYEMIEDENIKIIKEKFNGRIVDEI